MDDNANGDRDNPGGIAVIPPYIYLGTLLLGLLLDRKLPAPLLPRGMARSPDDDHAGREQRSASIRSCSTSNTA